MILLLFNRVHYDNQQWAQVWSEVYIVSLMILKNNNWVQKFEFVMDFL